MSLSSEIRTNIFELIVAVLLGVGALGGGWAGYQANQWGATATEDYGKAATTATKGSTAFNRGVAIANRDSQLDIQGKQLVLQAMTAKPEEELAIERDMTIAKYLYLRQMSDAGYKALKLPAEFRTDDREKATQIPDEAMYEVLEAELTPEYMQEVLTDGNAQFAEADKVFAEGQRVSGVSTKFGLDGMLFTITLFLGGICLVVKSRVKWGFIAVGYVSAIYATIKLFGLPWYPS